MFVWAHVHAKRWHTNRPAKTLLIVRHGDHGLTSGEHPSLSVYRQPDLKLTSDITWAHTQTHTLHCSEGLLTSWSPSPSPAGLSFTPCPLDHPKRRQKGWGVGWEVTVNHLCLHTGLCCLLKYQTQYNLYYYRWLILHQNFQNDLLWVVQFPKLDGWSIFSIYFASAVFRVKHMSLLEITFIVLVTALLEILFVSVATARQIQEWQKRHYSQRQIFNSKVGKSLGRKNPQSNHPVPPPWW